MTSFSLGFFSSVPLMLAVGPIALLLIDRGMQHGVRIAYPAAIGVAGADLTFATGAAIGGAALVKAIEPLLVPAQAVAVCVLMALAAHLAWSTLRVPAVAAGTAPAAASANSPALVGIGTAVATSNSEHQLPPEVVAISGPRPGGMVAQFFVLTAINPLTIVAFVSLVIAAGPAAAHIEWALGVAAASVLVHSFFVLTGAGLGAAFSPRVATGVRLVGAVSIAALALQFATEI